MGRGRPHVFLVYTLSPFHKGQGQQATKLVGRTKQVIRNTLTILVLAFQGSAAHDAKQHATADASGNCGHVV